MRQIALVMTLIGCFAACGGEDDKSGTDGGTDGAAKRDNGDGGTGGSDGSDNGAAADGGTGRDNGGNNGGDGPDGSTNGSVDASAGDTSASADVTPEDGGVVTLGDITVDVPAGAVSETTTITVRELEPSDVAALPSGFEPVGAPVALLPHGLTFDAPVSITLAHSGAASSPLALFRLEDEADTDWDALPDAVFAKDTVSVETTQFSVLCPGAESAPGDAGVDASTGDTDAGVDSGTDVTGRVVTDTDVPLADVKVTIGSATTTTDAAGEFTVADVPATYDAIVINADTTDNAVVYTGLTRRDPVFRFSRLPGTDNASTIAGTVQGPSTASQEELTELLFGASEVSGVTRALSDGTFSMPLSWSGPASTTGTMHGLRWDGPSGAGFARSYTAYGSAPLAVTGANHQVTVAMSAIGTGSLSGTLVLPSGYDPGPREFHAMLDDNTRHHVVSIQSVSPLFENITPPMIAGVQIQISGRGTAPEGGFATAIRHVAPTGTNIEIHVPTRPYLTTPDDQAVGITTATSFEWSPLGGAMPVNVVEFRAAGVAVTLVTTATTATLPDIPGFEFAPDTLVFWRVYGYAPFADVDAFVAPGAPVDLPDFRRVVRLRTDLQHAYSQQRRFTVAP